MQKILILFVLIASTAAMALIPPTYVRSVTVDNQTSEPLKVLAKFEKSEGIYEIGPHQQLHIEKDVNMGTWTEVDPVQQIIINESGRPLRDVFFQSPGGVVQASVVIKERDGNLQISASYK